MKKLLIFAMLFCGITMGASAQTVKKSKVKKTSTIPQKVHNTFSKHKKYSGTKRKVVVEKH
jgi:hypothetical protein